MAVSTPSPTLDADPVSLVFLDDAASNEGRPVSLSATLPMSPLVRYVGVDADRSAFRYTRLSELRDGPGHLVLGLLGSPQDWLRSSTIVAAIQGLIPTFRQHPKLRLLLDYSWEGGLSPHFFAECDDFVDQIGIEPWKVTILVSNSGIGIRYANHLLSNKLHAASRYRTIGMDLFLMYSAVEFSSKQRLGPSDALVSVAEIHARQADLRSRKFVSFNRRPRWHRFLLALMLQKLGMKAHGYVSMPSEAYDGDWIPETNLIEHYGAMMDPSIWGQLEQVKGDTLASLPWVLDVNMDHSGHTSQHAYNGHLHDYMADSYIQIVTESYMEGSSDDLFITEKVCKSLANLQPFVVLGSRGTLARLSTYGFEPPVGLQNDYDTLHDIGARLNSIFDSIKSVGNLSRESLHALYYDQIKLLEHNRETLFSLPKLLAGNLAGLLNAPSSDTENTGSAVPLEATSIQTILEVDPSVMTALEARNLVAKVEYWHHRFEIFPNVITPGAYDPRELWQLFGERSWLRKRVLEIGPSDGFYTYQVTSAGAQVTTVDYRPKEMHGFWVTEKLTGMEVNYVVANINSVNEQRFGTFDIVMFLGILYHLPDMLRGIVACRSVCRGSLLLETWYDAELTPDVPAARYLPDESSPDLTNFWVPNRLCIVGMLQDAGFQVVREHSWGTRIFIEAHVSDQNATTRRMALSYADDITGL